MRQLLSARVTLVDRLEAGPANEDVDEVRSMLEGLGFGDEEEEPTVHHSGPGPHPSGSPQAVHSPGGAVKWAVKVIKEKGLKNSRKELKEAVAAWKGDTKGFTIAVAKALKVQHKRAVVLAALAKSDKTLKSISANLPKSIPNVKGQLKLMSKNGWVKEVGGGWVPTSKGKELMEIASQVYGIVDVVEPQAQPNPGSKSPIIAKSETKAWNAAKKTKLTAKEKDAVSWFTSGDHTAINEAVLKGAHNSVVTDLDSALDKLPKFEGLSVRGQKQGLSVEEFQNFKTGKWAHVEWKAYQSTTLGKKPFETISGTGVMYIISNKGRQGSYVAPHSGHPVEKELLIKRGSKFRVTGYAESLKSAIRGYKRILLIEESDNIPRSQDPPKEYDLLELWDMYQNEHL